MLDFLTTQRAKSKARRLRRVLFEQYLPTKFHWIILDEYQAPWDIVVLNLCWSRKMRSKIQGFKIDSKFVREFDKVQHRSVQHPEWGFRRIRTFKQHLL